MLLTHVNVRTKPRSQWRRTVGALLSVVVVSTLLTVVQPAPAAEAYSAKDFNPELIISDSEFYNGKAMSESQIQSFLVAKKSQLANYRSSVRSRAARPSVDIPGVVYCTAFKGGPSLLASTIIFRAQEACGVSAKVLLVTLQKESSMVVGGNPAKFNAHMGYGCPDGGDCNKDYFGLGNQLYLASLQFRFYQQPRNNFRYQPGNEYVQYHPDSSCGGSTLNIKNWATAALYNYTPYQPTKAALAAYPGATSKCGAYGNRNFWFQYNAWFGSPTNINPTGVDVHRVGGVDRFETSVQIAARDYQPETTNTVYVANGKNFPDAVSAAPAAASQDAPLLLVRRESVPAAVTAQIERLNPSRIVVVGGSGVVSDAVFDQLAKLTPEIRRDAGVDRYETSRTIASAAFGGTGSPVAYLATGAGFADALSASAVAGSVNAPVILVNGSKKSIDSETLSLLTSLGVTDVFIAGGTGVVSSAIEEALRGLGLNVLRNGGSDRYATSAALNKGKFATASVVHVASGTNFPDALSAAALAGRNAEPLYLVSPTCIDKPILQQIVDLGAADMMIYGGTGAVGASVVKFANCR